MSESIFDRGANRTPLADAETAGGVVSLANPEGVDLYLKRAIINVTKESDGACTLNGGIAANGATSSDKLFDGLNVAAQGVFDNIENGGANGQAGIKWGKDDFLTISKDTGNAGGLEGELILEWVQL